MALIILILYPSMVIVNTCIRAQFAVVYKWLIASGFYPIPKDSPIEAPNYPKMK